MYWITYVERQLQHATRLVENVSRESLYMFTCRIGNLVWKLSGYSDPGTLRQSIFDLLWEKKLTKVSELFHTIPPVVNGRKSSESLRARCQLWRSEPLNHLLIAHTAADFIIIRPTQPLQSDSSALDPRSTARWIHITLGRAHIHVLIGVSDKLEIIVRNYVSDIVPTVTLSNWVLAINHYLPSIIEELFLGGSGVAIG